MSRLMMGVDPGKRGDPAAIILVETEDRGGVEHYNVRLVESPALGTSYTALVSRLAELDRKLEGRGELEIRVEANGVGEPVLDMARSAGLHGRLVSIYTTAGDRVTEREDGKELSIGKAPLITRLVTLLEQGRLHLPDTPEAEALQKQLERFGYETTAGSVKYEAQSGHDDLVMALALAVWPKRTAEYGGKAALARFNRKTGKWTTDAQEAPEVSHVETAVLRYLGRKRAPVDIGPYRWMLGPGWSKEVEADLARRIEAKFPEHFRVV